MQHLSAKPKVFDSSVRTGLATIVAHLSKIISTMTALDEDGLPLEMSLNLIEGSQGRLRSLLEELQCVVKEFQEVIKNGVAGHIQVRVAEIPRAGKRST